MRKVAPGEGDLAKMPFQNIQIDCTELPPVQKFKYLLTIVEHLTHWVKAFPTVNATANVVGKLLLEQVIPRYGIINTVDSGWSPHFVSRMLQQTCTRLHLVSNGNYIHLGNPRVWGEWKR